MFRDGCSHEAGTVSVTKDSSTVERTCSQFEQSGRQIVWSNCGGSLKDRGREGLSARVETILWIGSMVEEE